MKNFILLLFILCACSRDNAKELLFVGDSHVAYWDVNHYFVQTININEGKIGNKLGDINIFNCSNVDKVIIIIGFNDLHDLYRKTNTSEELIDSMIVRYTSLFQNLSSTSENYLISLFPMGKNYEDQKFVFECSGLITIINSKVKILLENYPNIRYVDSFTGLVDDSGYLKSKYSNDGLHLNNLGYFVLTNLTLQYVR